MRLRRSARFVVGTAVTLALTGATATAAMASTPGGPPTPPDGVPAGATLTIVVSDPGPDELVQCLTDHGGVLTDVQLGPDGATGKGFVLKSGDADQQAAFDACEELLPPRPGEPGGPACLVMEGGGAVPGGPGAPGPRPEVGFEYRTEGGPVDVTGPISASSDGSTVISSVGPVTGGQNGEVIAGVIGAPDGAPDDTVVGGCPAPGGLHSGPAAGDTVPHPAA